MSRQLTVADRMDELLGKWQQQQDRRASFLGCYSLMTKNMLQAIEEGRFIDKHWVERLNPHRGYPSNPKIPVCNHPHQIFHAAI